MQIFLYENQPYLYIHKCFSYDSELPKYKLQLKYVLREH